MTATSPRTLYRIDSTAVTLREYAWGRPAAVPVAILLKLLRVRIPSSTDDPNVATLTPFEVEAGALPQEILRSFEPLAGELRAVGFHSPLHHFIEDDLHHVRTYLATFLHDSGRAWARVHERVWAARTPPKDVLFSEFVTEFGDRSFVWSLSSKPDLAAPPRVTIVRRVGAGPAELWALHQSRVDQEATRRAVVPAGTTDDLRAAMERHHAAVRNFHVRRGVFAPLSPEDRRRAAANAQAREAAAASGSQYPDVLAEIRHQQQQKSSWTTAVLVLLVSLGLFLGVGVPGGVSGFSLETLLILIPVLFFHEAGHWLAMRFFGYRNLQMFFIPFLGAAVSGRHYNVPGWKRAVVSLMGPVPGVVVGALLGAAGLVLHRPLLLRVALTALILNGFNLLPILPLDGGWVVQAMLASRSVAFEVCFRVLAVFALFGWGLGSGDRPITYLGLIMLLGLPASYKLARVTRDLRRSGLEAASPDDQTIPVATAEAIITRVREAFPKRAPTRQIAMYTLQVFESLNARPPGALASLGLAFTQGVSLLGAFVFAALVLVGQQANLGGLMRDAQAAPKHRLDPAAIGVWHSPETQDSAPAAYYVVVATFRDSANARDASTDVQRRAPARAAVEPLGDSVLLALPADDDDGRKAWLAAFRGKATDVFVATPKTPANLRLSCLAPSSEAAAAIEEEARGYFLGNRMHLLPPWMEPDARTPDERSAHARARRTYARLAMWAADIYADPHLEDMGKEMQAAQQAGNTAELARLRTARGQLLDELRRARVDKLRGEPGTDLAVVERYQALAGDATKLPDPARLVAEIGPLLGQLSLVDAAPEPHGDALSAGGVVVREGLLLHLPFLRFHGTFEGPPALFRWLHAKGCSDFRYEFTVGYEEGFGDEEEDNY